MSDNGLPPPFVDATGPDGTPDGLPDVDELGRFVTNDGIAPFPFRVTGQDDGTPRDDDGRALLAGEPAYEYIDVNGTYLAALTRDLVPLLDADTTHAHETLVDLLAGFVIVAGRRQDDADALRSYDGGPTITLSSLPRGRFAAPRSRLRAEPGARRSDDR